MVPAAFKIHPGLLKVVKFYPNPENNTIIVAVIHLVTRHMFNFCADLVFQVVFHDVNGLAEKLFPIVKAMQKHFSAGSGAYYSDAIFFLSVAMHRIMPTGEPGHFAK